MVLAPSFAQSPVPRPISKPYGYIFGEPGQHNLRQNLDGDLVLDQCNLVHRQRRLDRDESHQWHSCGIADRHHDLHADLYWVPRFVLSSQYDGGCECRARRRSAARADLQTARKHRLHLRPTFAQRARRRAWRVRARGHGAAAVQTAVPALAARRPNLGRRLGRGRRLDPDRLWIWVDAWLGIYADSNTPKLGRSCIFRRFQISNLLQGAIQLRLVR